MTNAGPAPSQKIVNNLVMAFAMLFCNLLNAAMMVMIVNLRRFFWERTASFAKLRTLTFISAMVDVTNSWTMLPAALMEVTVRLVLTCQRNATIATGAPFPLVQVFANTQKLFTYDRKRLFLYTYIF